VLAVNLLGQGAVSIELGSTDGQQALLSRVFVVLNADDGIAGGDQGVAAFNHGRQKARFAFVVVCFGFRCNGLARRRLDGFSGHRCGLQGGDLTSAEHARRQHGTGPFDPCVHAVSPRKHRPSADMHLNSLFHRLCSKSRPDGANL